jgi:DNA mismatch repair protein MutL
VGVESSLINVKGFVGSPESARRKGALQFFFINGRYMRHPYFAKAVMEAYGAVLPQGEQVPFFICLEVDPSRIDVNIHPTKTEIKFEDEQNLWRIICAAVRE